MKHAWFSQKSADAGNGTNIYRTPDGQEIECTVVGDDRDKVPSFFGDEVYLGEIIDAHIRIGRRGKIHEFVMRS